MAFSLYDATVPNYLQTLTAVGGFLERGLKHFNENGIDPNEIVETRLAPDMLPLRFQIVSTVHHSHGAIEAARSKVFSPPHDQRPHDYGALQALVTQARDDLAAVKPDEINALTGGDIVFMLGGRQLPFVTEDFLMSFSKPNFYFHATTAYDILRHKGAPLGKRDFLGRMRMKT